LSTTGDKSFAAAIEAREVLYNLLALKAKDMRPRCSFRVGNLECFRPSAEMLTSLDVNPHAVVVDIPPLYDVLPFETALHQGHGEFAFTVDNKVLYFADATECDGCVIANDLVISHIPNVPPVRLCERKSVPTAWTSGRLHRSHSNSVRCSSQMVVSHFASC